MTTTQRVPMVISPKATFELGDTLKINKCKHPNVKVHSFQILLHFHEISSFSLSVYLHHGKIIPEN